MILDISKVVRLIRNSTLKKKQVTIIIPIYKEIPDEYELISLRQCCKILGHYPIRFVAPFELNTEYYENICLEIKDLKIERFNDSFFKNISGYNRLMLSLIFYIRFTNYQFILIYQLDAFVFDDRLTYWCKQNFDYLGAPWFENFHNATELSPIIGIGNGGFSLRKVSKFIKILKQQKTVDFINQLLIYNSKIYQLKCLINFITNKKQPIAAIYYKNEDVFWSNYNYDRLVILNKNHNILINFFAKSYLKKLNYAPIASAISFSFEINARLLYKLNNDELPLGCHAWFKYDLAFWKPFIESFGYDLP